MPSTQEIEEVLEHLDHEWEIVCDIAGLCKVYDGFPVCPDRPAEWVAFRPAACSCYPRHRLVCDPCRVTYIQRMKTGWAIMCPTCGTETGGFTTFVPIRGKA